MYLLRKKFLITYFFITFFSFNSLRSDEINSTCEEEYIEALASSLNEYLDENSINAISKMADKDIHLKEKNSSQKIQDENFSSDLIATHYLENNLSDSEKESSKKICERLNSEASLKKLTESECVSIDILRTRTKKYLSESYKSKLPLDLKEEVLKIAKILEIGKYDFIAEAYKKVKSSQKTACPLKDLKQDVNSCSNKKIDHVLGQEILDQIVKNFCEINQKEENEFTQKNCHKEVKKEKISSDQREEVPKKDNSTQTIEKSNKALASNFEESEKSNRPEGPSSSKSEAGPQDSFDSINIPENKSIFTKAIETITGESNKKRTRNDKIEDAEANIWSSIREGIYVGISSLPSCQSDQQCYINKMKPIFDDIVPNAKLLFLAAKDTKNEGHQKAKEAIQGFLDLVHSVVSKFNGSTERIPSLDQLLKCSPETFDKFVNLIRNSVGANKTAALKRGEKDPQLQLIDFDIAKECP